MAKHFHNTDLPVLDTHPQMLSCKYCDEGFYANDDSECPKAPKSVQDEIKDLKKENKDLKKALEIVWIQSGRRVTRDSQLTHESRQHIVWLEDFLDELNN